MSETHPLIKNTHLNGDHFQLEGGRTGILLVHGFTASTAEVRPLANFLHTKGYTISAPLLPGHNTHPKDVNHFTWEDWVAHIEGAYIDLAKHCEQVFVGGESTGALIALYMATYHPEFSGLLVYAPALDLLLTRWQRLIAYLLSPFLPYIKGKQEDEDDGLAWRGYTATPLKGLIQLFRLQKVTQPRLHLIRRPILIIQGRQDARIPPSVPQDLYDSVQSTLKEIHWMDRSSHCVILDRELDLVKGLTLKFLEKAVV